MRVKGTNKVLKIDIEKFHEALEFYNTDGSPEKIKVIEGPKLSEEDSKVLDEMIQGVEIKVGSKGALEKQTMLKVMKIIGDFAKRKTNEIQNESQIARLEYYLSNDQEYLKQVRKTLAKEEENITFCTKEILNKLKINPELFRRTEREYMMDPIL